MTRTISLESDLLGSISAHLRDLSGFATLAAELTQNADDAGDATEIRFDVCDDSLLVSNDGTFSSCNDPTGKDCSDSPRCDLHSFRRYAGQGKREKQDTTGAFGIGFTVAYQVTDGPELISSGQHWTLRPQEESQHRVVVCDGCQVCSSHSGTTFRLPWASELSPTRQDLGVDPILAADRERFLEEVGLAAGNLVPFLKRVNRLVLARDGKVLKEVTVERNGSIKVRHEKSVREFIALEGSFDEVAGELKKEHRPIEKKRSAEVTIAVPTVGELKGRPYATLPTNQETALNFHFNADFLPESDRKGIHLEDGYQAKWNRAALSACGAALADGLPRLREELAPDQLWRVIGSTQLAPTKTSEVGFQEALEPIAELTAQAVKQLEIVPLTTGGWSRPHNAWLLENHDRELVALLEELGVQVAVPAVLDALDGVEPKHLGLRFLDLQELSRVLVNVGLDESTEEESLPKALRDKARMRALWEEIEAQLSRDRGTLDDLAGVAVFPDSSGNLHPPELLVAAEKGTVEIFSPWIPFLDSNELKGCPKLREAVDRYSVEFVAEALSGAALRDESRIFDWFASHIKDIGDDGLESEVASLRIFQDSEGDFYPLAQLLLPVGGFEDPIGIARLFSKDLVIQHREFLDELGATGLTLRSYLSEVLPQALEDVPEGSVPQWIDPLLSMLSSQMDGQGAGDLRLLARKLPIVPTNEGLRPPDNVYIPNSPATDVLGEDALAIELDAFDDHRSLFRQLGVPDEPRPKQVVARVKELTKEPPQPSSIEAIGKILRFLTQKFGDGARRTDQEKSFEKDYAELREIEWLPSAGDASEWRKPSGLIQASQKHLVGDQFPALAEPSKLGKTKPLYRLLGIPRQPPVSAVVENLLFHSEKLEEPNPQIYVFLDQHHDDEKVAELAHKPCFLIGGRWFRADQVYRGGNSLSPLRATLPDEIQKFPALLKALNVLDEPYPRDGITVLQEIEEHHRDTYPSQTKELEPALWEAWRLIEAGLASGVLEPDQVHKKLNSRAVVPYRDDTLGEPRQTFFEDLPDMVSKFPPEVGNKVIAPRHGTVSALRAAGVRGLFTASEIEVDGGEPEVGPGAELASQLGEMREPILRVAGYILGGELAASAAENFDDLRVVARPDLKSRLRLKHGRLAVEYTQWTPSDVAFERKTKSIYQSTSAEAFDECELARQISLVLAGEAAEAAELISLLAHVFSSGDGERAQTKLDGLAIPRMTSRPKAEIEQSPTTEPRVEDQAPTGEELEPTAEQSPTSDGSVIGAPGEPGAGENVDPDQGNHEPDEDPVSGSGDPGESEPPKFGTKPPRRRQQSSPSEQWAMIMSYSASSGGDQGNEESEPGNSTSKKKVELVGVRVSMEHERNSGREPEEMPVNNPGFDVQSRNTSGEIVRFIEVKAVSGRWGADGFPKLTPTQIEKARELEERFWLYVIEYADTDSPSGPIRIQDPYRSTTRFVFDDGWRARAEPEGSDSEEI